MALPEFLSPSYLIGTYGLAGIIFIVFAETGLLFGFFFPGDSLLFLAGAYAATTQTGQPHLDIIPLLIGVSIAAVGGGFVGYGIGRFLGAKLFEDPKSRLFPKKYIDKTQDALERYGETKAVILARFIPIVRTFMSPVVGAVHMPLRTFIVANTLGGLFWAVGVTMLGYWLGSSIDIDRYILPLTALIIILSFIPIFLEYRKAKRHSA